MQHPKMSPPALARAAASGAKARTDARVVAGTVAGRTRRLADGVRQSFKIVGRRPRRLGDLEPHNVPAQRGGQASRVPGAQVVAMRLSVGRERTEHGRRFGIDIGEGRHGGLAACGAATAAKRTHEREPSRRPG